MIRYVLILVLAATVLGLTGTALDHASAIRGEQAIETEIAAVDSAATSLYDLEGNPSKSGDTQRVIELDIPEERLTKGGTETLRFERIADTETTRVTYSVDERIERTTIIRVPIRQADGGAVDFSGRTGTLRVLLTLETDQSGEPVVTLSEY